MAVAGDTGQPPTKASDPRASGGRARSRSAGRTVQVAVVVLTFNAERYVDTCFESLRRAERSGIDLRIIAVDNGSRDATVARMREGYPEVCVIETGANLGFAAGNNVGIERALGDGAEFVYLL